MQRFSNVFIASYLLFFFSPPLLPQASAQIPDARKGQADQLYKEAEFFIKSNMMQAAQLKLEEALQLYQAISDNTGQRETLISLGYAFYREGRYQEALQYLQQAESIPSDISQRGRLLTTQGLIYLDIGEYERAYLTLLQATNSPAEDFAQQNRTRIALGETLLYLGVYNRALDYLRLAQRTAGDRTDFGRNLNAIGEVYFELGQYEEAKKYYQEALAVRQGVNDRRGSLRTLNNLGRVEQALGDPQAALKLYSEALNLVNSFGDERSRGIVLNNLGLVALELGLKNQSLSYLEQALGSTRNIATARVQTLTSLGLFYRKQKEYDKAIDYYQQAIGWARQNGDRIGETKALSQLGETYLELKKTSEAIETLKASAEAFESLRPGLRDEEKVSLFETQSSIYNNWQVALVQQGNAQAALEIAERGRARAFIEILAQRLSSSPSEGKVAMKYSNLADIVAIAKKQQATLVTYSILSNSEVYVWVINPNGNVSFKSIDLKPLEAKQQAIVASLPTQPSRGEQALTNLVISMRETGINESASSKQTESSLQEAYQLLIQPIANLLPSDPQQKVVFIPQGSLFLVPFQALQDEQGKFLIEKHTIVYAPSIQALSSLQTQPPNNSSLIIGNPDPMPANLLPLPGAETEAKAIAEILATQPIVREQATEAKIVEKISQAGTIHFATHGLLNEQEALQSSLALVPSQGDDGFLTAGEIFDLKLKANLVVLSACDTGRGKITGDGVIGLSRSLLAAGVANTIVSLWAVPDQPTASLMVEFYRNLKSSPDKAQALRQAMLTQMKATPSPRNWAAFIMIGAG